MVVKKKEIHAKLNNKVKYISLGIVSLLAGFLLHWLIAPYISSLPFLQKQNPPIFELVKDEKFSPEVRKSANQLLAACRKNGGGEFCYANQFGLLTKATSLKHAIDTLYAVQSVDTVARGCHLISHSISIAETEKDPSIWKEIIAEVPPDVCTGGFVHGVLEARMIVDKNFTIDANTVPEVCAIVDKNTGGRGKDQDCSHIMGHLLMVETGGDIKTASAVCDSIPQNLQYECQSGVFMENETRENLISHKLKERLFWNEEATKAQEDICRQYTGTAAKGCWREVVHMYAFIAKDDPLAVYRRCSAAPEKGIVDDCYLHGVGIMAVSFRFDQSNFGKFCTPYTNEKGLYYQCMSITIGSLLTSTPEFSDRAIAFCNAVAEESKYDCFGRLGERLAYVVEQPLERERYCTTAPEKYKKLCLAQVNSEQ